LPPATRAGGSGASSSPRWSLNRLRLPPSRLTILHRTVARDADVEAAAHSERDTSDFVDMLDLETQIPPVAAFDFTLTAPHGLQVARNRRCSDAFVLVAATDHQFELIDLQLTLQPALSMWQRRTPAASSRCGEGRFRRADPMTHGNRRAHARAGGRSQPAPSRCRWRRTRPRRMCSCRCETRPSSATRHLPRVVPGRR